MRTSVLAVVVSSLAVSGWALAAQKAEQKQDPSMMEHMMKEGEDEKNHRGMMRKMKMMDQCSRMMESSDSAGKSKESQTN
jgi:hypothetical protein